MSHRQDLRERATSFIIDVWNQRAYARIPTLLANPVLLHIKTQNIHSTHAQLRDVIDRWHARYREFRFDIDRLIVEADMAVLLLTLRGRPAASDDAEAIAVRHVFLLRFEDRLIVEAWELNDFP